jgi:hypothetical protein
MDRVTDTRTIDLSLSHSICNIAEFTTSFVLQTAQVRYRTPLTSTRHDTTRYEHNERGAVSAFRDQFHDSLNEFVSLTGSSSHVATSIWQCAHPLIVCLYVSPLAGSTVLANTSISTATTPVVRIAPHTRRHPTMSACRAPEFDCFPDLDVSESHGWSVPLHSNAPPMIRRNRPRMTV